MAQRVKDTYMAAWVLTVPIMMSKYMVVKWERRRIGMVHVLW